MKEVSSVKLWLLGALNGWISGRVLKLRRTLLEEQEIKIKSKTINRTNHKEDQECEKLLNKWHIELIRDTRKMHCTEC